MEKKKKILIGGLALVFLLILIAVVFQVTGWFDSTIYQAVRLLRCNFFDNYFIFITKFGNPLSVLIVVLVFILLFRNRDSLLLSISAFNSVFLNMLIKQIIRRERPNGLRLIKQGGYSFPSGHAMISVCVYGFLLYLVWTKVKNKYLKYGISVFLLLLILSIGISRIYVGVHYATDVLAGYILATIEVILLIELSNKYSRGI